MLKEYYIKGNIEAGCDEAGRGPLAGPVMAAAVILPEGFSDDKLNDSKKMTPRQRNILRRKIEEEAAAWAVATIEAQEIDELNILHASTHAMCLAVKALLGQPSKNVISGGTQLGNILPQYLLIDGNRFYNETPLPFSCFVGGDGLYSSIAAASVLAKTHRDELMQRLHSEFPQYGWDKNKGYPTLQHYDAIEQHGITPYHRRSFNLFRQHTLFEPSNVQQDKR